MDVMLRSGVAITAPPLGDYRRFAVRRHVTAAWVGEWSRPTSINPGEDASWRPVITSVRRSSTKTRSPAGDLLSGRQTSWSPARRRPWHARARSVGNP